MKKMNKAGKLGTSVLNTAILGIVLLVVLFQLYAQLVPEAQKISRFGMNEALIGLCSRKEVDLCV